MVDAKHTYPPMFFPPVLGSNHCCLWQLRDYRHDVFRHRGFGGDLVLINLCGGALGWMTCVYKTKNANGQSFQPEKNIPWTMFYKSAVRLLVGQSLPCALSYLIV